MRDHSMELAKVATSIVTDILGGLTAQTYYSPDGNNTIMEFSGYPLYGSKNKTGKVYVQFPRSTFYIRRGNVKFTPIQQRECRYYQSRIGEQFAHPHVFNDGHPCWDRESKKERAVDFISNIIETLAMVNVTRTSVTFGRCASNIMGVELEALQNAQAQAKKVFLTLKSNSIVTDRWQLESYVYKRWCSKISILMKSL